MTNEVSADISYSEEARRERLSTKVLVFEPEVIPPQEERETAIEAIESSVETFLQDLRKSETPITIKIPSVKAETRTAELEEREAKRTDAVAVWGQSIITGTPPKIMSRPKREVKEAVEEKPTPEPTETTEEEVMGEEGEQKEAIALGGRLLAEMILATTIREVRLKGEKLTKESISQTSTRIIEGLELTPEERGTITRSVRARRATLERDIRGLREVGELITSKKETGLKLTGKGKRLAQAIFSRITEDPIETIAGLNEGFEQAWNELAEKYSWREGEDSQNAKLLLERSVKGRWQALRTRAVFEEMRWQGSTWGPVIEVLYPEKPPGIEIWHLARKIARSLNPDGKTLETAIHLQAQLLGEKLQRVIEDRGSEMDIETAIESVRPEIEEMAEMNQIILKLNQIKEADDGSLEIIYGQIENSPRWDTFIKKISEITGNGEMPIRYLIARLLNRQGKIGVSDFPPRIGPLKNFLIKNALDRIQPTLKITDEETASKVFARNLKIVERLNAVLGELPSEYIPPRLEIFEKIPLFKKIFPRASKISKKIFSWKTAYNAVSILSIVMNIWKTASPRNFFGITSFEKETLGEKEEKGLAPRHERREAPFRIHPEAIVEDDLQQEPTEPELADFLFNSDFDPQATIVEGDDGSLTYILDFGSEARSDSEIINTLMQARISVTGESDSGRERGIFCWRDGEGYQNCSAYQLTNTCFMHALGMAAQELSDDGEQSTFINPFLLAAQWLEEDPEAETIISEMADRIQAEASSYGSSIQVSREAAIIEATNYAIQRMEFRNYLLHRLGITISPLISDAELRFSMSPSGLFIGGELAPDFGIETRGDKDIQLVSDAQVQAVISGLSEFLANRIVNSLESGEQIIMSVQSGEHTSHSLLIIGVEGGGGEEILLRVVEGEGNNPDTGPQNWGHFLRYQPQSRGTEIIVSLREIIARGAFNLDRLTSVSTTNQEALANLMFTLAQPPAMAEILTLASY